MRRGGEDGGGIASLGGVGGKYIYLPSYVVGSHGAENGQAFFLSILSISEGVLAGGTPIYERPEEVGRIGNCKTFKFQNSKLNSKEAESSSDRQIHSKIPSWLIVLVCFAAIIRVIDRQPSKKQRKVQIGARHY